MGVLLPRNCWTTPDGYYYCSGAWDDWGRWVAFAVIVGCAFLLFFLFACFSARRRRQQGLQPYMGTAWMAPPPYYGQNYQPPPQYPGSQYGYYNSPGQAYGPQQNGVELQPPSNAYRPGDNVYTPPSGPPPKRP